MTLKMDVVDEYTKPSLLSHIFSSQQSHLWWAAIILCVHIGFNISQTLSTRELCHHQRNKLIPTAYFA